MSDVFQFLTFNTESRDAVSAVVVGLVTVTVVALVTAGFCAPLSLPSAVQCNPVMNDQRTVCS